jgi:protein-tyrosine phosphatase
MAERLLRQALIKQVGPEAAAHYRSHGAGTGTWHIGEPMHPSAARQLRACGADPAGFVARSLREALIDESDLVLCATSAQVQRVVALRAAAQEYTFVLGEFGRLLAEVDRSSLPPVSGATPADRLASRYARGVALVAAVHARRHQPGGHLAPARPADDLDDPWGLPDREYARTADEIEATIHPLAVALAG